MTTSVSQTLHHWREDETLRALVLRALSREMSRDILLEKYAGDEAVSPLPKDHVLTEIIFKLKIKISL